MQFYLPTLKFFRVNIVNVHVHPQDKQTFGGELSHTVTPREETRMQLFVFEYVARRHCATMLFPSISDTRDSFTGSGGWFNTLGLKSHRKRRLSPVILCE